MDYEGLAELIVPLVMFAIIGGLIALRMLKPYGNRILELIKEIQQDRHQALEETRDMQTIRDRLDMLTERQDFLEALLRSRLDEEEREEIERLRRRELGSAGRSAVAGGSDVGSGEGAAAGSAAEAGGGDAPDAPAS